MGKKIGRQKELKLAMVVGCILTSSNAWAADITGNSSSGSASLSNQTQNSGGVYGWKYDDTSAATGGSVTLTNADVSYSSGSSASGVESRPVKPVPPVTRMPSTSALAIHCDTSARSAYLSSRRIARWCRRWPASCRASQR